MSSSYSADYASASYEEAYKSEPKPRQLREKKAPSSAAPRVAKQSQGKDKGCNKPWVAREIVEVCEKVKKDLVVKRCRTVVDYKTVIKKVTIIVQEPEVKDRKCTKRCDNSYCKPVAKWVDVCVNGNQEKDCQKKGCCKGSFVRSKRILVISEVKVACHEDVCYTEQHIVICDRKECVEVPIRVAVWRKEEYEETVQICDLECKLVEKDFPQPTPVCPSC